MLVINRQKSNIDRVRNYKIILDDTHIDNIKEGEIKNIDIKPGKHTLYMKIDWCRSNKIDFYMSKDETVEFKCGNSISGWRNLIIMIYITFLKDRYLWLERKSFIRN